MGTNTGIEWTNATWNPVVGCTKVSPGCKHCYAKTLHDMRHQAYLEGKAVPAQYAVPFEMVQLMPERLDMPLHWKKPRLIFVNSVSDLFHEAVPFAFIDGVFATMQATPWHTYQVLTKRPERAIDWLARYWENKFPLNVWMGVSVENQAMAEKRIPLLLQVPSQVHFLSCEPLLGEVDLQRWLFPTETVSWGGGENDWGYDVGEPQIDWVICGGESGAGARPMHANWARSLQVQCAEAEVPFFFKQHGEWLHDSQFTRKEYEQALGKKFHRWGDGSGSLWVGKQRAGHLLDGVEWRQMP